MPAMSEECQERLLNSRAVILGASESALVAARFLIESGLGKLEVYSDDKESKAFQEGLSDCAVSCFTTPFNAHSAESILENADVAIDGLKDWQGKLLASDICMQMRKNLIHAGSIGFRAHVYTMRPGRSACVRCVLPEVGIDDVSRVDREFGYFPPLAGLIGAFQAIEATKLMAQLGAIQGNELLKYDGLSGEIETIRGLDPVADCPDCGRQVR